MNVDQYAREVQPGHETDNVGQFVTRQANDTPNAIALISPGLEALDFAGLQRQIDLTVDRLKSLGIGSRHRVGVALPNSSALASLVLSLLKHCTLVPLNPGYRQREFEDFITRIGIDVLITENSTHAAATCALAAAIPVIEFVPSTVVCGCFELKPPTRAVATLPKTSSDAPAVSLILHTSGSTAEPKIVPLDHRNLGASVDNLVKSLALSGSDRCLNMMPMFHIGALLDLLLAPLSVGGSVIVPETSTAATFFHCLQTCQPSWYQGVPTMLRDIVATHRSRPQLSDGDSTLRLVRSVSSALPNRLLHEIEALFGSVVIEIYGMTETTGLVCSNPLEAGRQKQGSVGLPQGCEIAVRDKAGRPLAAGLRGEVTIRGTTVMRGYESDTARAGEGFVDGYFRSGDEGYFDEEGYLYLTGRIKEIINRGGEKISPLEIDRVAEMYPGLRAAAAFAIPHPSLGEEVGLAVIRNPGIDFDEDDFSDFLQQNLARHKIPRKIYFPAKLPRAPGGKLRRHEVINHVDQEATRSQPLPRILPRSALAVQLAQLWSAALEVTEIGIHDNFFDLGGDSLTAAAIIGELRLLHPGFNVSALYDHPTIRALEDYLGSLPGAAQVATDEVAAAPELVDATAALMAVWKGERLPGESLLVGRNTGGGRTPIFWCVNGYPEFDQLARQMETDQPIYGMRSLFNSGHKTDIASFRIAQSYVDEISQIQPKGPYLVGGFCEGGKIAFHIAQILKSKGNSIASLMLQEQFVASHYDGRVAILICNPGRNNPYYNFREATRGWRKFYSGDLHLYRSNGRHKDCYLVPDIKIISAQIKREVQQALAGRQNNLLDQRNDLQRFPLDAYRARIAARPPERIIPGSTIRLDVEVTNNSNCDWLPTAASGLILGAKWLKPSGETKTWMAGSSDIMQILHPGESIRLPLDIRAPFRFRPYYLELDLVDDGVAWFADMGSTASRHLVRLTLLPT
jgi:acyl-CoA synthetase (AMP-forming)/AMP-acid ligase II/thioesterase domain-containing protein